MGVRTLMNTLAACYGRQMNITPAAAAVVKKDLDGKLTPQQGRLLGERLVRRHTFCPSAAEILAEWRDMRRREAAPAYTAPPPPVMHPDAARRVRAVRDAIRKGTPLPVRDIPPEIRAFARRWFPEISDDSIRRNWPAICACRDSRQEEARLNSPYATAMAMGADGVIELVMKKAPQPSPE